MLLIFKIAYPKLYVSYRQSIYYLLSTLLVKSKLYILYSLFLQGEEVETYLENLKEKKGLSGKYQTSSKLFQNCSELFKAQVMFDSGWREIEVKYVICIFADSPFPTSQFFVLTEIT